MVENRDVEVRLVVTDEAAATDIQAALEPIATARPLIIDQFGIDGEAASGLVLLATATVQSMPAILEAIRRFLDRDRVGEIEVPGVIRVVGPRAQDVDRIIERLASGEGHGPGRSQ
jgi:hypothetical protein